ncbi:Heat shock 70 kDa protein 14 [Galemys pyrenaicus]|uniref:Heat shock 70 kDa protein 14 n=1 Tax=Galemys pyrenaicus TaxID=202257 RepID=A0A8J6ACM3_GALPY|nr:Heat shock 70 kDa protein 14 [Galemys pyrenaicus]
MPGEGRGTALNVGDREVSAGLRLRGGVAALWNPRSSFREDGRADVVANDAGDRVTPAVVAYSENEEVVGLAAKQSRIRNISNTVMKVKQILGRRMSCFVVQVFPPIICLLVRKRFYRYTVVPGLSFGSILPFEEEPVPLFPTQYGPL